MTDQELRDLIERNAAAIERNAAAIERNAAAIERNFTAIDRNSATMDRLERKTVQIDRQIEANQRQLELVSRQVQAMTPVQASNSERLISAERNIQGIYDLLNVFAKEQAERSKLIDQQIQALIDERRRS